MNARKNGTVEVVEVKEADEHHALGWMTLAAIAVIFWLMKPVGTGILLGALMAFSFQPVYERLVRRWRPSVAGLVTVLGSTLAIVLTFGALVWILIHDGTILGRQFVDSLQPGGAARRLVDSLAGLTSRVGIRVEDLEGRARGLVEGAVSRGASVAQAIASTAGSVLLAAFFSMLTMSFILREWPRVSSTAQDMLPIRPEYTLKLFQEFRRVGRTTLMSTGLTALAQGALAAVGYLVVGLPRPLFFAALTTAASPVPGVGTMLVWAPAGIVLILLGHVGRGIALLAWGVVVVTAIPDYVIRPRLVGRESEMPALLTFTGLFGGVELFGFRGLLLGPLLMAVATAVAHLYADETRARRAAQRS
jgi:predicted PurR-regulated permease PerM